VFDAALLHKFSCKKCVNFKAIIPEEHHIIPDLFLILLPPIIPKIIPA